jgi:hypothetical protein
MLKQNKGGAYMLYESKNSFYVFANNKYYRLKLTADGNLVPTKEFKYSLEEQAEIDYDKIVSKLESKKVKKNTETIKIEQK